MSMNTKLLIIIVIFVVSSDTLQEPNAFVFRRNDRIYDCVGAEDILGHRHLVAEPFTDKSSGYAP